MATKAFSYESSVYQQHMVVPVGSLAANVAVAPFSSTVLLGAAVTVTTASSNATTYLTLNQVTNGNTVPLTTVNVSTSAAGSVVYVPSSAAKGGVILAQGDMVSLTSNTAATTLAVQAAVEIGVAEEGSVQA